MRTGLTALLLVALYVLHNDWWLWDDSSRFLGLPVGLTYHVLFCVAVSAVFAALAQRSRQLRDDDAEAERDEVRR